EATEDTRDPFHPRICIIALASHGLLVCFRGIVETIDRGLRQKQIGIVGAAVRIEAVSVGRVIRFRVTRTFASERMLRYGDWDKATERACFSASSNTTSPVEFEKSEIRMRSLAVNGGLGRYASS